MSFSTEAPEKAEKPRKGDRLPVKAELVIRHAGRRPRVLDVSDLSRFGCCLAFDELPRVDEWVWVALPGLAPVEARIRWVESRRAGVEFVHPIHQAVFDLLLLRWGLAA
nr:PilZ domain-containing protein [Sphingomonas kaistensis]